MKWSLSHAFKCGAALIAVCSFNSRLQAEDAPSFRNDVMAILSKAGCNAGQCHGNANGKASFKLSLRGESAELDYYALTHDQLNRRVDLLAPEQSLILLKPTTQISHEGGVRFKTNSWEYKTLVAWIEHGAKNDSANAPRLQMLEVTPRDKIVVEPTKEIQISAEAIFSNGSTQDVRSVAVYESANPIVKISPEGLVQVSQPVETTVLVRYLDQQIPVRLAFIPARTDFKWSNSKPNNYVDRLNFARLEQLRMNPSELCTDEAFVRRVYLDLHGKLPSAAEARRFVFDRSPQKRSRLIDDLLEQPEFADFWALKWSDLLRNEERILDRKGSEMFYRWVRQSILEHKPMDQFAREILSARGSTYKNPAANFFRAARTARERGEAAAQLFLGRRIQCAQCHNHPFDQWSQDDYYDWMTVFSRLQYKVLENRRRDNNDGHEFKGEQILFLGKAESLKNPRSGNRSHARFLGDAKPFDERSGDDELEGLARWLTRVDNPFFAKAQANRVWFHLFGRGLVEPLDDFRASNPASNPELLDALAKDFVDHGFDLRSLIRVIMNSRTYQLSVVPNSTNEKDELNFARSIPRRLTAEQLLDCQSQVAGYQPRFVAYPPGTRAVQVAGALSERNRGKSTVDTFLAEFGKPPRLLPSECERSSEPTMSQAFQLVSGLLVEEMITAKENQLSKFEEQKLSNQQMVEELYWAGLSRAPTETERTRLTQYIAGAENKRDALEDILWGIVNSKEFIYR